MRPHWCLIGALLTLIGFSVSALAVTRGVHVTTLQEVTVYSQASEMSSPLGNFKKGARLYISTTDHEGWRRVLFITRGKKRSGWILSDDIDDSLQAAGDLDRSKKKQLGVVPRYRDGNGLGVSVVTSHMQQESRELSQSDSISVYQISELTSTTFWLSVFYDAPLNEKWALRPFVTYRKIALEGQATLEGIGGGPSSETTANIEQTYLGAGMTIKAYFANKWWWGGGFEAAKNLAIRVSQNGQDLPLRSEDKPFFLFVYAALGTEAHIFQRIYFVPELKAGSVSSIKPSAYVLEAHLSLSYQW